MFPLHCPDARWCWPGRMVERRARTATYHVDTYRCFKRGRCCRESSWNGGGGDGRGGGGGQLTTVVIPLFLPILFLSLLLIRLQRLRLTETISPSSPPREIIHGSHTIGIPPPSLLLLLTPLPPPSSPPSPLPPGGIESSLTSSPLPDLVVEASSHNYVLQ